MKFTHLKNALLCLVAIFSLLLVVAAIQFVFWDFVSVFVKQSVMFVLLCALIFASHFWTTSHENSIGIQKVMMNLLYGEMTVSMILGSIMIYGGFDFYKTLVLLLIFQAIHLAIYLCYMFLYDEKPIKQTPLTHEEILEKSRKKTIDAAIQE